MLSWRPFRRSRGATAPQRARSATAPVIRDWSQPRRRAGGRRTRALLGPYLYRCGGVSPGVCHTRTYTTWKHRTLSWSQAAHQKSRADPGLPLGHRTRINRRPVLRPIPRSRPPRRPPLRNQRSSRTAPTRSLNCAFFLAKAYLQFDDTSFSRIPLFYFPPLLLRLPCVRVNALIPPQEISLPVKHQISSTMPS